MLSHTASKSKFVWCSGRSGRSFSVAALASNAKRNDNENDRDDDSANYGSLKGKRVSKSQRRAMVEVFVNEYKAMNDGKLPCVSILRKEIGGSFYVLKNIHQELELQQKMPALDQNASEKAAVREDRRSSKAKDVSESETPLDSGIQTDTRAVVSDHIGVDDDDASVKHIEAERVLQSSSSSLSSSSAKKSFSEQVVFQDDRSEFIKAQYSHLEADNKNTFDSIRYKPGTDEAEVSDTSTTPANLVEERFEYRKKDSLGSKESTSSRMEAERVSDTGLENVEDLQERDISKDKTGQDDQTSQREHEHSAPTSVAEKDPKESTLWVNIKSFADGLKKLWRKS